jgi:hypothetical protein
MLQIPARKVGPDKVGGTHSCVGVQNLIKFVHWKVARMISTQKRSWSSTNCSLLRRSLRVVPSSSQGISQISTPSKLFVLEQINHDLIDQPLDWCVPKPGVKKPVTQDHHRQTNDLKGSAIKVYRLRGKKERRKERSKLKLG